MDVYEIEEPNRPQIDRDKLEQFAKLREEVNDEVDRQYERRIAENPVPTEQELLLGTFVEGLEPQVKDAVLALTDKGYTTVSSGFYGDYGEYQCIDVDYKFDEETKDRLRDVGAVLNYYPDGTFLEFYPENPDLDEMKKKWKEIVDVIEPTGKPAVASIHGEVNEFRLIYSNPVTEERMRVEAELGLEWYRNPEEKSKLEKRLSELKQLEKEMASSTQEKTTGK